jgi:hypothetical protein
MGRPSPERRSRLTFGRSPVRESRTPGSARGDASNGVPYRDRRQALTSSTTKRFRRLARMDTEAISMKATRCSLVRSKIVFNRR